MKKLTLNFIGIDSWNRPVFEGKNGKLFKDTNLGNGQLALCTAYSFDGEPNTPISYIKRFEGVEIEITGMEEEPTREEKFNYMMLSRLQSDCNYFLGNGNRNVEYLWENSVQVHIDKMKKLHNTFSDDKKPEWLTWDQIMEYESKMKNC